MKKTKLTNSGRMPQFCLLASLFLFSACQNNKPVPTSNPVGYITEKNKLDMIYSLVDLEGDRGRIYEMNYTVDYKLDEALNANIVGTNSLVQFTMKNLMDV